MVAFLCRYSTGATTTALFGTAVLSAICKRDKIQLDRDVILRSSAFLPRSICYSSTPPWWGYWDVRPDGFLHNFLRVARLLVTPYPLTHGGWVFYLSRVKDHWNDPPSTKALSSTITRLSTISITQVAPRGGCWYRYSAGYQTWTGTLYKHEILSFRCLPVPPIPHIEQFQSYSGLYLLVQRCFNWSITLGVQSFE